MNRRARGFTLLEVLVAMSLLSVLVTVVYTGVRMGLKSWDSVQARSQQAVAERTTRNWLRRQIAALVPVSWRDGPGRIAFAGDTRGFRFFGHREHATRGGGVYLVELREEAAGNARRLVLSYRLRAADETELVGVGEPETRGMGGPFSSLRFDYFGATDDKSPRRWRPLWPSQAQRFPELVRVRAERADERPWPDLVVALPAAAAGGVGG